MIIPRYPGGKSVFGKQVRKYFPFAFPPVYVEPFVGGGSMLMNLVSERNFREVWINDLDRGVAAVYQSIQHNINELCWEIENLVPSVELWERCKRQDATGYGSTVERAVNKLFLHAGSHGGLGAMAGSAQGGKSQDSEYKIDCRWNPLRINSRLRRAHRLSHNWRVTSLDFEQLEIGNQCFVYADPPYFKAGSSLYKHSFSLEDHRRLRRWLNKAGSVVVSYDNSDEIDGLYADWDREVLQMGSGNNPKFSKRELVIWKE